ncbi:MAG: disulfide bond formation protein B [Alicyclobacillus herbarius]|uniref:disulfide bond formation protein B n=1 Tax=Alicyclobacillus herbarius TaxID=122960 RepID=UPI000427791C|nr:disulfide bond formation protein B [Alicyclobacillus herbarius]MCL6633099.1 disulfide bond formation protein B [Alicyclobacillus herbarius]
MNKWFWLRLGVSLLASLISLYWSLGLGWLPCDLCWYERICMYPIALISLVAFLCRIPSRPYTLTLAAVGSILSLYHYLLQVVPQLGASASCTSYVSCATPEFVIFGFITPPLLAFVAFLVILAADIASRQSAR